MAERWQQYEDDYLVFAARDTPISVLAKKLERSEMAIATRAAMMGLRKINGTPLPRRKPKPKVYTFKQWASDELALFFGNSNAEIARITGRPIEEVANRRLLENLRRNDWLFNDPEKKKI
ncbi:hypothetical protein [Serratia fonticola]